MRKRNSNSKILILVFVIALMGLGYAYLTSNLKILGTAHISNTRLDVHFANPGYSAEETVTFPSNGNSNVDPGLPVIKGATKQELEWGVIFNEPGDSYEFYADVVNDGDITADIDYENSYITLKIGDEEEINSPLINFINLDYGDDFIDSSYHHEDVLPEYLYFYVSYRGLSLEPGENGFIDCEVYVPSYRITAEEWENIRGTEIKMSMNLKFVQSDGSANYNNTKMRVEKPVVNAFI